MASESKSTTNHATIKKWIEARGGKPASVKSTKSGTDVGLLRVDFPGYKGEGTLEEISWDEFFKKFDEKNLAFLYQDKTADNEESRFCKFVSRETAEHEGESKTESKGHNLKADEKAHKAENKTESKGHNLKADEKAHKAEQKTSEKTHSKSTHK